MILADFSNMSIASAMIQDLDDIDVREFHHNMINNFINMKNTYGPKYGQIYICQDNKNYWRKDVFEHYKANRKVGRDASTFNWSRFYEARDNLVNDIKSHFPYKVLEVERAEADDIIGTLAITSTEPTLIYANDGDFKQCHRNPLVKMYRPQMKKFVDHMNLIEIEWDLFFKICKGDGGDGIPSIANPPSCLVEKVRQKAIRETSVTEWFKSGVPEEFKERFEQNKTLIDLRETPQNIVEQIFEAAKVEPTGTTQTMYNYLQQNKYGMLAAAVLTESFF